jgi:uncharacterized protein (DUF697 family)
MAQLTLEMKATILATSVGLGTVGLFGAFAAHSDLLAITPAWTHMFLRLAKQAGKTLDKDRAVKITSGVLMGATALIGGIKLANTYFAYSGVGTIPAIVVNAGVNGVLTWLAGRAWAQITLEEDLEQSVESLVRAVLGMLGGWLPGHT